MKLSCNIPLSLNIWKNPDFVGRGYLLENLKQEIDAGKDVRMIIVLYGTGGMGKTQLALEYVYQNYQDYCLAFWVNTVSVQSTTLGFIQIMHQLIEHHIWLLEDVNVAHIGWLLGMPGKLDSTGGITVISESNTQHVVDAIK